MRGHRVTGEVAVEAGEGAARRGRRRSRRRAPTRRSTRASSWSSIAPPARAWSSSVRSRCSCSVAGNSTRARPAANDGTGAYQSACSSPRSFGAARRSRGRRSLGRRRTRPGSATAPARWCAAGRRGGRAAPARPTRWRARRAAGGGRRRPGAARRGSAPSVARRSASGSSESSCTRVGKRPSARPHTNTRSRSSPSPSATWPMSRPSPKRPTRPRSASSSSSSVRRNTSTPGDGLDRVEAGQAGRARRRSSRRPAARPRASRRAPGLGGEVVADQALGPPGEVAPARGGIDPQVAHERRRRSPGARGCRPSSRSSRCGRGSRSVTARSASSSPSTCTAYRSSRCCQCSGPRTISAARLMRSQLALGTSRPSPVAPAWWRGAASRRDAGSRGRGARAARAARARARCRPGCAPPRRCAGCPRPRGARARDAAYGSGAP